jgi:hypothetical protein
MMNRLIKFGKYLKEQLLLLLSALVLVKMKQLDFMLVRPLKTSLHNQSVLGAILQLLK